MAPPKRLEKKKRFAVDLEPYQYKAIQDLLKKRPDLGSNPTDFARRRILEALEKPPAKRKR